MHLCISNRCLENHAHLLAKFLLVICVIFGLASTIKAAPATFSSLRDPCKLVSASDINRMFGSNFRDDPKSDVGRPLMNMAGSTLCSWIAPPLREFDTGTQRNVAMIVVTFWPQESIKKAQEWLYIISEPIFDEKVTRFKGLGDEAIESSSLFVRKDNLVFAVRFAPYTRAPRDESFLNVEGSVAELILSRLK